MFWFFLNAIVLLIFGNTLIGFIITKSRLMHKATDLPLTIFERAYYCFIYLLWIGLFFIPIANIFWIFINIIVLFTKNKVIVNVLTNTYFKKYKITNNEYKASIDKGEDLYLSVFDNKEIESINWDAKL